MNTKTVKHVCYLWRCMLIEVLESVKTYTPLRKGISRTFEKEGQQYLVNVKRVWRSIVFEIKTIESHEIIVVHDLFTSNLRFYEVRQEIFDRIQNPKSRVSIYHRIVNDTVCGKIGLKPKENANMIRDLGPDYDLLVDKVQVDQLILGISLRGLVHGFNIEHYRIRAEISLSQSQQYEKKISVKEIRSYLENILDGYKFHDRFEISNRIIGYQVRSPIYKSELSEKKVMDGNSRDQWIDHVVNEIAYLNAYRFDPLDRYIQTKR